MLSCYFRSFVDGIDSYRHTKINTFKWKIVCKVRVGILGGKKIKHKKSSLIQFFFIIKIIKKFFVVSFAHEKTQCGKIKLIFYDHQTYDSDFNKWLFHQILIWIEFLENGKLWTIYHWWNYIIRENVLYFQTFLISTLHKCINVKNYMSVSS